MSADCGCSDNCRDVSLLQGSKGNPGRDGQDGTFGANSDQWQFNTGTVGNPGSGYLLFNNADLTAATSISVSKTDQGVFSAATWLAAALTSNATPKGFIRVNKEFDSLSFAEYSLTSGVDNGSYYTYTISYLGGSSASPFALDDNLIFSYVISGNNGSAGTSGTTLIPLTYPQNSNNPAGTDTFTFNIPANTLVNDGDIVEFEAEVEVRLGCMPADNGTGGVTFDIQSIAIVNNGTGNLFVQNVPFMPYFPTVRVRMTVTKTGATAAVQTHELYTPIPTTGLFSELNGAANFAANIPLQIAVNNSLGAGSTNVAPFAIVRRAIMKYLPA